MFRQLYKALSSTVLFIGLAALLGILIVIPTIVPELSGAVYRGPLLIALGLLLEANLLLCTVPRLVGRIRAREVRPTRYAADIIHLGLVLLIAGGLLGFVMREEARYFVPTGEQVTHRQTSLRVADSRQVVNADGLVTDWWIDLSDGESTYRIALNRPAQIGEYRVHFFHWGAEETAVFVDGEHESPMRVGEGLRSPDGVTFLLESVDDDAATFAVVDPQGEPLGQHRVSKGESLGGITFGGAQEIVYNGFSVSRDPSRAVMLLAFVLVVAGMLLYAIRLWRSNG